MKTVYPDENTVVIDENTIEIKPCINRESKSDELTNLVIQLSRYQHEVPSSCNTTNYISQQNRSGQSCLQNQAQHLINQRASPHQFEPPIFSKVHAIRNHHLSG